MISAALATLATVSLQGGQPASAPVPPPLPNAIRLGDTLTLPMDRIGNVGHVLRLDLAVVEPLTLVAESYDGDVSIAVENGNGTVLAFDDDTGTQTNAHLFWSPSDTGSFSVRLSAKPPRTGTATIRVLRGNLDAEPPDPRRAAKDYGEFAYYRAMRRTDEARVTLALELLAALSSPSDRHSVRQSIETACAGIAESNALLQQAKNAREAGDVAVAREHIHAAWIRLESIPASEESSLVAESAWSLGFDAYGLADLRTAASAWNCALRHLERILPDDHPDLLVARQNVAVTAKAQGDLSRARSLDERVVASNERTLPEGHPYLLAARQGLAATAASQGDLPRARALFESTLAVYERTLPEDHPVLLTARHNLAATLFEQGDSARARALEESVLAVRERTLAEDDSDLLRTRQNLALIVEAQGDLARARALEESVLAVRERTLPEDHPDLLAARQNLAASEANRGDLTRARALKETVLAARERTLPEDHPDLLAARQSLAVTARAQGDLSRARILQESVLAAYERILPEDHPNLLRTREGLALTVADQGDLRRARALLESVLGARERALRDDHPELLKALHNLARNLASLRDMDSLGPVLSRLASGARAQIRGAAILAPREVQAAAAAQERSLGLGLSLTRLEPDPDELLPAFFAWIETRRAAAAVEGSAAQFSDDPEVEDLRRAVSAARQLSSDLTSGLGGGVDPSRPTASTVLAASSRRDDAERALAQALAQRGRLPVEVDCSSLASALRPGETAVGFHGYTRWNSQNEAPNSWSANRSLLVHVVAPDGSLQRIELGPLAPIEEAVEVWRLELGSSVGRGAGAITGGATEAQARSAFASRRLRELVVDPIRAAAPNSRSWSVCLDGALHLVPLEALPTERGVLGDEVEIRNEVSFERLLRKRVAPTGEPSLLVIGGVDFGAEATGASIATASSPPLARSAEERGGVHFGALPRTSEETQAIASYFETVFGEEPRFLEGARATKAAFVEAAPRARWLHLATHGYYSDANVRVLGEPDRDVSHVLWQRASLEETVKGLSPYTLCGLALAGANRGRDSLGRVPGILTAEELAGLDLRRCELAVLSACETHVGLDRGASGMASLQAALHAAGARSAITSLWKVDDERTRELMVDFYRRLWVEEQPVAAALWNAKKAARAKGWPVRDWAGWILTGDPGDDPDRSPATRPANATSSDR